MIENTRFAGTQSRGIRRPAGRARWRPSTALLWLAGLLPLAHAQAGSIDWQDRQQLVTVVSAGWDDSRAVLLRHHRQDGDWQTIGEPVDVVLGRSGSAWGIGIHPPQAGQQKREGDGRAPAGLFAIGTAFGYADSATTGLAYQPMQRGHHCIDVPASPLYNRIVDVAVVGEDAIVGSTEPMRRDLHLDGDPLYRLGFVIEHNGAALPEGGSCIFAHLWRGPERPTAGCTAMAEHALQTLLAWLEASRQPRFLLLPSAEYARLESEWDLPTRPPALAEVTNPSPD